MRRIIPAILFFLLLSIGETHASQDDSFDGAQSMQPIFAIFRLTILDNEAYTQYITKFIKVIKDYDGQAITKDEITRLNPPQESNEKAIIITFEDTEQFEKCFTSPEYLDLLTLRSKSVTEKSIVIKGYMRRRDFERFGITKIIPRCYELSGSINTIKFPKKEYIIHDKLPSDFEPDLSVVVTDQTGKGLFIIFKRGNWISDELDYGALYVDSFWGPEQFPSGEKIPVGSKTENNILEILEYWLNEWNLGKKAEENLRSTVKTIIQLLEERRSKQGTFTKEEAIELAKKTPVKHDTNEPYFYIELIDVKESDTVYKITLVGGIRKFNNKLLKSDKHVFFDKTSKKVLECYADNVRFIDESHEPMPQEDKQAPETIPIRMISKAPPVFMIFEMGKVGEEPSEVYKHRIKIKEIINKYSEVYISGGNGIRPFSGGWRPYNIDLIKFETLDKAKECFNSKEYLENATPEEKTFTETAIILESN